MDKIWLKHYPQGVASDIQLVGDTLVSKADDAFKQYANCYAFKCHGVRKTFAQVEEAINNLAKSLSKLGVTKGDRVAVIMPNILQYPITIFAILKLGAIVVNINPLYTSHEMEFIVENSGAKVAIVLNLMASKLDNIYAKGGLKHIVVTKMGDTYPFLKRNIFNFAIKYIKRLDISYSYPAHNYREMLKKSSNEFNFPQIVDGDIAFIQYTGATTGKPKGAILLHRNIVANLVQIHNWLTAEIKEGLEHHVVIGALPLYHIFSLTANLFTFFFTGCENVLIPNPRDIKEIVSVLKSTPFDIFNALDTLYNHLLNSPEFVASRYPRFRYSVAGGMPSRESVARKWFDVTGVYPANCYGLTEASPAVTLNRFDNTFDGSVGFPIPSTDLEVRDPKTHELLPQGEIGLIYIRGPQVMRGYWNNPEASKDALDDNGWFNTKDLGYLNEQGKLFLTGRLSELIIISGFNVYPAEVEAVLDSFAQIKESAVIGVPDEETGETVIAYIVLKPNQQIDEIEIRRRCREKLTKYKCPRHILIVEDLPKTLVGKIDKVSLVQDFIKGHST